MTTLSTVWTIGITPIGGAFPNVRGVRLPPTPLPPGPFVHEYIVECLELMLRAHVCRTGCFDLRFESIRLTMLHTLARVQRGA